MKDKRKFSLKNICLIIFVIYLIFLIKIILFKYRGAVSTLKLLAAGELSGFRSYNLIPFQSVAEFTKLMFNGYFSRGFNNIIGNICVFVPFGYFLPLLFKKCRKWKSAALSGLLVSFLFETLQYLLYLGSSDIDDIILNLTGVTFGFLIFQGIRRIASKKQTQIYVATIVLSVIGFFAAGYIAVDYFGIMFGMTDRRNQSDVSQDNPVLFGGGQMERVSDQEDAAQSNGELNMYGTITELLDSGVIINRVKEEDLGNGISIASINPEEPDLQTVYITETTRYMWKDIYDVNGERVEMREASKEDLQVDKNINIKGYQSDHKFYADEIVIENFLFRQPK